MIAFAFSFPAGRYHATPWGRHTNEADVAWPPEPVRILRALIATWWRKADQGTFKRAVLDDLVDALALEPPVFLLPDAVHTHVRAFMPAPTDKKLIYDAFLRFDSHAELTVAWPNVSLTTEQEAMAAHLLQRLGYFGRAESWAEGRIAENWSGEVNACPRSPNTSPSADSVPVDVTVSLTPASWAERRERLLAESREKTKAKRAAIEATLPERLSEALAVDTGKWQQVGWSNPPPLRRIVYDRSPIGPLPPPGRRRSVFRSRQQPGHPEMARFVLAGRPHPRIEDALRIGEIARLALMSGNGDPPPELSGRNADGPQRHDPAHAHAFFLPEDADDDGFIDHLIVFCRCGFSEEARMRLDRLNKLWLAHGHADGEGVRGRKEWRLALEDIAAPEAFAKVSALVGPARSWMSATPYLTPWHRKKNLGVVEQVSREIERRGVFPALTDISISQRNSSNRRAIEFHRFRSRRGLPQTDTLGSFLCLNFADPVLGPFALGFACHYGLGMFVAVGETRQADED